MNDFIIGLILKVWDTFKIKNPKIAAVVILALGAVVYFANQGTLLGLFILPEWASGVLQFLGTLLGFLIAPHTENALAKLEAEKEK